MRVLYHIPCGVVGGAETQVQYLVNNLPKDVTALITYEYAGIEPFVHNCIKTKFVHRVHSANDLQKKINEFSPDIIQIYHAPVFYGHLSKISHRAKVVEIAHNSISFQGDCSTYGKEFTDVLVCVSPDTRDHYISKRGNDVRMVVIPNGVDTNVFYPGVRKERPARLTGGYCGRLEIGNGKGVDSIVTVVKNMPVDFEFVGYDFGNWKNKLKDFPNMKYLPHTPDIADYYRKWDFFVSCSPKEGFGLAIAEALACGLPTVVYNCGGICGYLKHKEHAYIANNLSEVEAGIREIMAGATYNPLKVDFSAKKMAENYVDLYNKLIDEEREKITIQEYGAKVVDSVDYVLGIAIPGNQGIHKAIETRVHDICPPEKALVMTKQRKPSVIVFGGFIAKWFTLAKALKQNTKAKVIITYHGSSTMNEFSQEIRDGLSHAVAAVKEGFVDYISFPHEGMAKAIGKLHRVKAVYEPNPIDVIQRPEGVQKMPGLHIGLFSTGLPWKNIDTQILAAAVTPGLTALHVQNLAHPEFPNQLGITYKIHPYHRDRREFYKLLSQMTVSMSVTLTEAFGYFPVESMMLGVPCIVGATTPSLRGAQGALKKCIVNYIDDPTAISDAILEVVADYNNVVEEGYALCKRLTSKQGG